MASLYDNDSLSVVKNSQGACVVETLIATFSSKKHYHPPMWFNSVLRTSVTDHYSTALTILSTLEFIAVTDKLTCTDWVPILNSLDIYVCNTNFYNIGNNAIVSAKTQIKFNSRWCKKLKLWITKGLVWSITAKNKLSKSVEKITFQYWS